MKRKILMLSIPIALCILGIIYLQVDWTRKTYGLEFNSIDKIADFALANAVAKVNEENLEMAAIELQRLVSKEMGDVTISFPATLDSLHVRFFDRSNVMKGQIADTSIFVLGRLKVIAPKSQMKMLSANLDTLSFLARLNWARHATKHPVVSTNDSLKLVAYFKEDLKRANLQNMPDEMKILFLHGQIGANGTQNVGKSIGAYQVSLGAGLHLYQPGSLSAFEGERVWVGVYFGSHQKQIMARMMYGSLLSMALVVVMVVCFLYLIGLLMKQRRIGELKDDFISNLTHEFKTPISTISAAMEAMQNFNALNDVEKTNRYLKISRTELTRLDSMVSKVLDIASYENKTLELDIQPTDLSIMIAEIKDNEQFRNEKEVSFMIDIAATVKILPLDKNHFRNVIVNLVDNAVKYAGPQVNIQIKAWKAEQFAAISISDNGIGISAIDLESIFDKFFRVQKGNIYNAKGTGIGLSYVKSIIELHHGKINVQSELNVGTTFTIYIPLFYGK